MATRWEYVTVSTGLDQFEAMEDQLNSLGSYGWELVNVVCAERSTLNPPSYRAVLKRAVTA